MKDELKNKIKSAFENETPDFKEKIVLACENETQEPAVSTLQTANGKRHIEPVFFRRMAVAVACVVVCVIGIFLFDNIREGQPITATETRVYLDVNPSLELSLDENNVVLSCIAANEDAEIILSGMNLAGVELKTALNAIVGSMYVKGYLTSNDNSMLISVDTKDQENAGGFLSYITEQINDVFADSEMECAIIAQSVNADENLKRRAEENGISVGKMHLLDKLVENIKLFTEKDIAMLSNLSIKDLNLLYTQKRNGELTNDELISGIVGGIIQQDEALLTTLEEVGATIDDVEKYYICILPSKTDCEKVAYVIMLKLYDTETFYKYEVNYETGESSPRQKISPNCNEN